MMISADTMEALKAIDTPTICNAIEALQVRGRVEGFLGLAVRDLTPTLDTMIGYAVTATVDSTTPEVQRDDEVWKDWLRAMDTAPKPFVLVFQDVGPQSEKSAHLGEVMGQIARRFGGVGFVTDGGLRDIKELRTLGFHCFGAGLVPAHGNPRIISVGEPVKIDGVRICSGDLIHGDENGVTTIPMDYATEVVVAANRLRDDEIALIRYITRPESTVDGLIERKFKH